GQRPLHARSQVPVDGEARAAEFGRALQVEHAQLRAQFPVRLGGEVELGRRAPAPRLGALFWCFSGRGGVVGQVGDIARNQSERRLDLNQSGLLLCQQLLLAFYALFLHLYPSSLLLEMDRVLDVLQPGLRLPDFLRSQIYAGFISLDLVDEEAAFAV